LRSINPFNSNRNALTDNIWPPCNVGSECVRIIDRCNLRNDDIAVCFTTGSSGKNCQCQKENRRSADDTINSQHTPTPQNDSLGFRFSVGPLSCLTAASQT